MITELETYLEYTAILIIALKGVMVGVAIANRKILNLSSYKWVLKFIVFLAFISLVEWVLGRFVLSKSFPYYASHLKPLMETLGIVTLSFFNPIHYLIRFIFLGLFFRDSLQNPTSKKVFQYAVWVLVIFELVQVFVFKSYQGYDSLSSTIKNFFVLGGAGLLLYRVYREPNVSLRLQKNPYFWICLGLILPALAELFLEFVFTKLYQTDLISFYKLYLVRNASQIIGFTLLIVGVWQVKYLRFLPKMY